MTQRFSSFFAKCMTQRMNWSFLENMTLGIEIFERKTDSKNWTFSKIDSMDWTFCFTWPKELNLFFFLYNSKDWTFFIFKPFFNNSTQWLTLFWTWLTELNLSFQDDSKNWTYDMTQSTNWIFFLKIWRKELNVFWIWLTELNHSFLNMTPRIEPFCQYLFFIKKKIHRFEPFSTWLRENEPDFQNLTQRIEPSSQKDSKNWTLKDYLIPTTKPSYDSWKWTFFCIWIKEIKPSFSNLWFKLLDLFFEQNSQNWTF